MRIVADESVPAFLVERLRADGHTVMFIAEIAPGAQDPDVLARALVEASILLTADKDFGELVVRLGLKSRGVALCRLSGLTEGAQCEAVSAAFRLWGEDLFDALSVIGPGVVRIRPIATPESE